MPHHRAPRSLLMAVVGSFVICAVLAGCGTSSEPAPAPAPAATTKATPSPQDAATAAFRRYWDAYVQMANSGEVRAADFEGIADGSFVELDLKTLGDQADAGIVRVGEPEFSDYATTVDGDTGTSLVCFDERSWGARSGDRDLEPPGKEFPPTPLRATLELRSGAWIVTDVTAEEETPCPGA